MRYISFLFICLICVSCGYRFGQGTSLTQGRTISVPYIEGDQDGDLTAALIKECVTSGGLRYARERGDLILKVKILTFRDENIGFRYDRKKSGKLDDSLLPSEVRLSALAEVVVLNGSNCKIILGPARINASVDFDYCTTCEGVNVFSLGQLSDLEAARNAAMEPLNRTLAQRIVDYLTNSW